MSKENREASQESPENSKNRVDEFLRGLTSEQREILSIYASMEFDDMHFYRSQVLMQTYGPKFTWLAHRVQELITEYGCSAEAMRLVLQKRLSTPPPVSGERITDTKKEVLEASVSLGEYAGSVMSSSEAVTLDEKEHPHHPPISSDNHEDNFAGALAAQPLPKFQETGDVTHVNNFVQQLTEEGRAALEDYLRLEDRNSMPDIAAMTNKHGRTLWQVTFDVQQLEDSIGCSHDDMKNALKIALGGDRVTGDHFRPSFEVRKTVGVPQSKIETVISTRRRLEQEEGSGFFGRFRKKKKA